MLDEFAKRNDATDDRSIARHADLAKHPTDVVRATIRSGRYGQHTAGLAAGKLQANLVILDEAYALDFARYCQRNAKSCPNVGMTDTGDPMFRTLGRDLDIRSDVPSYNIYRNGKLAGQADNIRDLWTDRSVAFAIGCSFTFEHALQKAGIRMRHIDEDRTVPMYRTSIETVPAGPFRGGMVVSMRPIPKAELERVDEICRTYPQAHGAPVHCGDPADIGIADLVQPDWGSPSPVGPEEVAVFWACGVTPQNALMAANLPLVITHTPGCMIVTDVAEDAFPTVVR
ncbi:MAG: putative hydro-lyase [Pseudomonadota bacterium]